MGLADTLRPHQQQTNRGCAGIFLHESFCDQLGQLDRLCGEPLSKIETLKLAVSVPGGNSRRRNQPLNTCLTETITALHPGNAILDKMNPTGTVTLGATLYAYGMIFLLTHCCILHGDSRGGLL